MLVAALLLDLDGTLVDTAPDLVGTVNRLRLQRGLSAKPYADLRPYASHGSYGLIRAAFDIDSDHPDYEVLRQSFLRDYQRHLADRSVLFAGMRAVLHDCQQRQLPWGIVTNKPQRFTQPLVQALGIGDYAVCVSGDSTPHSKPHPQPLLYACQQLGVKPEAALMVGDDPRDIAAGQAAGCRTLVAGWGYLPSAPPASDWGADVVLDTVADLQAWLMQQA